MGAHDHVCMWYPSWPPNPKGAGVSTWHDEDVRVPLPGIYEIGGGYCNVDHFSQSAPPPPHERLLLWIA